MRKNQYEEALFRAEDERYDVELIIGRTKSTIKALMPIQECIESLSADAKATYHLPPNTLRAFHIRTIEKIYAEKGHSVVGLLKNHPVVSVPVVLCRLQQKLEEWMGVLKTMNKHWQTVADMNYHKSLDHRSFYFKQQDKKSLAPKTLLQELKDEAEAARTNHRLLSFSAGVPVQSLFVPHLQFTYDDNDVHEDVFSIIRFAASKMLAPDVWKQTMEIWTKFLEPFLYLTPHSFEDDMLDVNVAEVEEIEQKELTDEPEEEETRSIEAGQQEITEIEGTDTNVHSTPEPLPIDQPNSDVDMKTHETEENKTEDNDEDHDGIQEPSEDKAENEQPESSDQEEQNPSAACEMCKPLATVLHVTKQASAVEPTGLNVFFCNEPYYLFLRYHEILFSRIKLARKCCREQNPSGADESNETMVLDQESTERRHSQFMSMVYALIDGSIDIAQFEDQCRSLLSTNSYVLFTLDKLIRCVVKQLQTIVLDDPSKQVWELYKYESARTTSCDEGAYYANTKTVVREDYVVRACSHPSGLLTLTHLDNSFVYDVPNGHPKFGHTEYFGSFMDASERKLPANANVYLNRNKDIVQMQSYDPTGQDDDKRMEEALETGSVENGLEMKVSGDDYKVKFIEGTSDIWLAAASSTTSNDKEKRTSALRRWILTQLPNVALMSDSVEQFMTAMQRRI